MDNDLTRFRNRSFENVSLQRLDLVKDVWPFGESSLGGIINVHFLLPSLFPWFERSLAPGRYVLLETEPGCGGNYMTLPTAKKLSSHFGQGFQLEFYHENKVGPRNRDAVTVKMLARKQQDMTSV